jgi:hypothetical protein
VVILPFHDRIANGGAESERKEPAEEGDAGAPYREAALALVEARFRMHGIEYVRRPELAAALARLKLLPERAEDRAPARLRALAHALAARAVITGVIEQASGDWRRRGVLGEGKAEATVRLQIFDVRTGRFAEGGELTATAIARSKEIPSRSSSRAQKLRARAVREATNKSLAAFLKPYPTLYEKDPGETFIVYATPAGSDTSAATAAAARPAFPTTPVVFTLTSGARVEGKIQKIEHGIYTVLTEKGKVVIAQEYVLSMKEKR